MSVTIESITIAYENRKIKSQRLSPYSLFLIVNAKSIYDSVDKQSNRRPDNQKVRNKFREVWSSLDATEKQKYETVARQLGYRPRIETNQSRGSTLEERLKQLQMRIDSRKVMKK